MNGSWPQEALRIWMHNAHAEVTWRGPEHIAITQAHTPRPRETSYITSLRSGWFDYAAEELRASNRLAAAVVRALGWVACSMGLDRLLLVGNQPVSTHVWRDAELAALPDVCTALAAEYPRHFLGIRNLLPHVHGDLMAALKQQGFHALPARVIYEFDLREGMHKKSSHAMRDRSALKKSGLCVRVLHELNNTDAARVRDLYKAIYIDKHSTLNAQYTAQFFSDVVNAQLMRCLCMRNVEGKLLAFAMLYQVGQTLTVPALGYDSQAGIEGLYRLLFAAVLQHTETQRLLLNYSSGAGDFKRKRGGVPRLEYTLLKAPQRHWRLQHTVLSWAERRCSHLHAHDLIALGA